MVRRLEGSFCSRILAIFGPTEEPPRKSQYCAIHSPLINELNPLYDESQRAQSNGESKNDRPLCQAALLTF